LLFTLEQIGKFEERAIEQGAIIISKLNQPGFDGEPTEFDQMARPFPALHDPGAVIVPGDGVLKPMPCRRGPVRCLADCRELLP
jgi:hypothetical protein